MSPSSGARSGTSPGRTDRGAGTGRIGPTILSCGHAANAEPLARSSSGRKLYYCLECCGLKGKRT